MGYAPLVSVIVPVYKTEKFIHRCIDSVLNQTYSNWEMILVDDGSPDACGQICDSYAEKDGRIHVIHQENQGLSAARNAGIKICKGEWIYFLDSDDFIVEDALEKMIFFQNQGLMISSWRVSVLSMPMEARIAGLPDGKRRIIYRKSGEGSFLMNCRILPMGNYISVIYGMI